MWCIISRFAIRQCRRHACLFVSLKFGLYWFVTRGKHWSFVFLRAALPSGAAARLRRRGRGVVVAGVPESPFKREHVAPPTVLRRASRWAYHLRQASTARTPPSHNRLGHGGARVEARRWLEAARRVVRRHSLSHCLMLRPSSSSAPCCHKSRTHSSTVYWWSPAVNLRPPIASWLVPLSRRPSKLERQRAELKTPVWRCSTSWRALDLQLPVLVGYNIGLTHLMN